MDTAGYLRKHGWRGTGHSLDQTDRGITKPLQISKKVDFLGVGVNKYAAVSDQWWMRAYDQGLKDLGSGKESALASAREHGVNRGGLYARFVSGAQIPGTIDDRGECRVGGVAGAGSLSAAGTSTTKSRKRKVDDTLESHRTSPGTTAVTTPASQPSIKHQIKAFIDEATKQGILPAEPTAVTKSHKHVPPAQHDLDAVLRMAKMHKRRASKTQLAEREKLVRNLRRAALKYLESQAMVEPT